MRPRVTMAVSAAMALVFLMSIAYASHDPEREGWYVELNGTISTPGNTNTALLVEGPSTFELGFAGPFESKVHWMEWDDDLDFSIGVGYSWGEKGSLKVTYWTYDDTASSSGLGDYYSWFTVGPTSNVYYTYYYETAWDFQQTIEAETLDVEYTLVKEISNPFTLIYGVGLRYASFEDTLDGRYNVDPSGFDAEFPAMRVIESDGIGFTGTVGAAYDFTDLFGISTDIRVGFITAEVEAEHRITDLDGYYSPAGSVWLESTEAEDEVAMTMDLNFNLLFRVHENVEINAGYSYTTWSELSEVQLSRAMFDNLDFEVSGFQIPGENRDRISWSGPRVGVTVRF